MSSQNAALQYTLAHLRSQMASIKMTSVVSKQATKECFIEPLLRALGWDLSSLSPEVQRDRAFADCHELIDYVLSVSRIRRVLVVARPLRQDLGNSHWLVTTASQVGVRRLVLTNGDAYRMYDMEERLCRTVYVHVTADKVAESLSRLTKQRVVHDIAKVAPKPVVSPAIEPRSVKPPPVKQPRFVACPKRGTFTPSNKCPDHMSDVHTKARRRVPSGVRYCVRCCTTYLVSEASTGCPGCT
jgi:hypothetical protein